MSFAETHDYSVREFVDELNATLEDRFGDGIWITGEIEGLKAPKPHFYFDLIEKTEDGKTVKLSASIWQFQAKAIQAKLRNAGVPFENGIKVRVFGKVDFYGPFGKLSLKIDDIDPNYTLGEVQAAREALLRKLTDEGVLEVNAQLEVPLVPTTIGIVTSFDSAAWHDIHSSFENAVLGFRLIVCDSKVQGDDAPDTIVAAIKTLQQRADVDLIVVARGGGSRMDLAAFDDERIARAIIGCSKPVFVAVGHEIDTSIADAVAHTSFKTPTACAEGIIQLVMDFIDAVDEAASEIVDLAQNLLERSDERIKYLSSNIRNRATVSLSESVGYLSLLQQRLTSTPVVKVDHAMIVLDGYQARLRLLDPVTTMKRGWSITRDQDGNVVTELSSVKPGTSISTQLADGIVESTVDAVVKN